MTEKRTWKTFVNGNIRWPLCRKIGRKETGDAGMKATFGKPLSLSSGAL
jgi:hypothetical protein